MNCKEALPIMHEYLDGDLEAAGAKELQAHMLSCAGCRKLFKQLEMTEALVGSGSSVKAPANMTDRVMQNLPPLRNNRTWGSWFRKHPAASVAAVFVLVMMASFASLWQADKELLVKGTDLEQVVIKGDTVYIPAGHKVTGNLMVRSGKLQVDGEIDGNVVVIDGTVNMASTAHISGQVIDQAYERLIYEVNQWISHVSQ
jgi:anti-sigma factor RsiW